ncbi:YhcH/YjgK/YiaL family protein [Paenibacillus sp. GCM10023252]|uniref:YhcH/YjgK/YiaL family protein n=1 Tax=Paenibacillus sp. GCM10023252 TaxID=3252649 RepID=UPI00360FE209
MIIGQLSSWEIEHEIYSERLQHDLKMLQSMDWQTCEDGEYEVGKSARLIVKEVALRRPEQVYAERHIQHVDIHYVIRGYEMMGWARDNGLTLAANHAPAMDDHLFFQQVQGEQFIRLNEGMFIVLLPGDVHRPCCLMESDEEQLVRKAVLKIKMYPLDV